MLDELSLSEASDLIGLVYNSALEKNQWSSLIVRLIELNPGHVAAVATFEDAEWRSSHVPALPKGDHARQIKDVMDAAAAGELEQAPDLHEVMFSRQPLQLGTLFSTREIFSDAEFRGFESYKATMQPIGAGHYAGVHISISEGRRAAVMVVENDFAKTDKNHTRVCNMLDLIAPHLVQAARFARTLTIARNTAETYAGFIDAIALPLLVTTADGQLQMTNAMGQRLMDADHIIQTAENGQIRLPEPHDTAALYAALGADPDVAAPRSFQAEVDEGYVVVCVCPFRPALSEATGVDRDLFGDRHLYAIFIGARPGGPISLDLLRDAFNLSPREAEVCGHLLQGLSPAEVATRTDRAEKTVRNQIQSVYEKVGVSKQRDLIEALAVFRTVGEMFQSDDGPPLSA